MSVKHEDLRLSTEDETDLVPFIEDSGKVRSTKENYRVRLDPERKCIIPKRRERVITE